MLKINRTQSRYSSLITGLLLFCVFFSVMAVIQFSTPNLPDNDGFYHIKFASLIRSQGLKPHFPYLPLTILNPREFYDHHFLFHIFLVPFTMGDLRLGAKWAAVFFASIAFICTWLLLRGQKVPFAAIWALGLLAVSEAFLYRMSVTRAQSLSLAVLVLSLHFMLTGKYKLLLPLGILYVWFYNAFPLLIVSAVIYTMAVGLIDNHLEWRPVFFSTLGILIGLVVNIYFPDNLIFTFRHFLPKLIETTSVQVGNEWYPYNTLQVMTNSAFGLLSFLVGALALGLKPKRMDTRTAAAFFLAVLFGVMMFQSRRFVEYYPAFSLIFAAFAWTSDGRFIGINGEPARKQNHYAWGLLILVIVGSIFSVRDARKDLLSSKSYQLLSGSSQWLKENTQPGERIFQTDWDDFPRLFFYNTHNTYLVGLDPTYWSMINPDRYDLWVQISRGEVENPAELIRDQYGSRYVITDLEHDAFIQRAQADPGLQEVFRDENSIVYKVID